MLDGSSREEAAKIGGMDRQTLRDWVIRFNEEGPDGLVNKSSPGAPSKLSEEHYKMDGPVRIPRTRRSRALCAFARGTERVAGSSDVSDL